MADGEEFPVLLGFDPGGKSKFGWCIAQDSPSWPLRVVAVGLADDAASAVEAARARVPGNVRVLGAGIDAPLFWARRGGRQADRIVRCAVASRGVRSASGTVQEINSLRGACLVQGVLAAIQLREWLPGLTITESHPKALLHLLPGVATSFEWNGAIAEDERDAALGAVGAWAAIHRPAGWVDLAQAQTDIAWPCGEVRYWMPGVTES